MKCENCGGNLTLEDVVCPHCESVNQHAIQHIRDMKRYRKDYEGTKEGVYSVIKNYVGVTVRIVIIAVLIVLIFLCARQREDSFSIKLNSMRKEAEKNAEEHKAVIDDYLENGEFRALDYYLEVNVIGVSMPAYEDYKAVFNAISNYSFFYADIIGYMHPSGEKNLATYPTRLEEDIRQFYELFDEEHYINIYIQPQHKEYILQMKDEMEALMITYCGLTEEEAEGIWEMSKAERMTLLEERLLHEE
jgi:hypothetical protein